MHIRKIQIDHIKLLRSCTLSFLRGNGIRKWTVLVGENGIGKTTILQAIAAAASGRDRANQLANVPSLPDVRETNTSAVIEAEFTFGPRAHNAREYPLLRSKPSDVPPILVSRLTIAPQSKVFSGDSRYEGHEVISGEDPLAEARAKSVPNWFVAGYGVDRKLPQPRLAPKMDDPVLQRLAPLFDVGPIVGTGFADQLPTQALVNKFSKRLQEALVGQRLLPRIDDMELRGQGGIRSAEALVEGYRFSFRAGEHDIKVPATWLSQGYQAMIAWVADIIGQMFWDAGKAISTVDMEGLVLIDEIDIHLHPMWQIGLIHGLKKTFPNIQFVVTTHSPMVLPGFEADEILHVVDTPEGNVQVLQMTNEEPPALMTGTELYNAYFGAKGLYPSASGEILRRYSYLSTDSFRSDEEDKELVDLANKLRDMQMLPDWKVVAREAKS